MKYEELKNYYLEKDEMTFTPQTTCERKEDKNGNAYGEYTITKTADEVYKEWLDNKKLVEDGYIKVPEPSTQDILSAKLIADNAQLLKANEEQKKLNADLLLKIAMLGGQANV